MVTMNHTLQRYQPCSEALRLAVAVAVATVIDAGHR
jgi:hypothetical protein